MIEIVSDEFFFFKQKTAYELRISDWSSDVCSSDLIWQARRLYSLAPSANCRSSASAVPSTRRPTLSIQAGSTWKWQVAQAQTPPQSPSMPGTSLKSADRKSVV